LNIAIFNYGDLVDVAKAHSDEVSTCTPLSGLQEHLLLLLFNFHLELARACGESILSHLDLLVHMPMDKVGPLSLAFLLIMAWLLIHENRLHSIKTIILQKHLIQVEVLVVQSHGWNLLALHQGKL